MAEPAPPALRRCSRILGWMLFAAFELFILALASIAASIRCCTSSAGASPQSASEWVALGLFAGVMLLLGAVVGLGGAFAMESVLRLLAKVRPRCETDP